MTVQPPSFCLCYKRPYKAGALHPLYSTDLAPCDFLVCGIMKETLTKQKLWRNENAARDCLSKIGRLKKNVFRRFEKHVILYKT